MNAVIRIETSSPGNSAPSLATELDGGSVRNHWAYSSFIPAKSPGSVSRTPTSTTSSRLAPPACRMASQFASAWRVWTWMVLPASSPVLGSMPVVPEMNSCDPALTAWLYSGE